MCDISASAISRCAHIEMGTVVVLLALCALHQVPAARILAMLPSPLPSHANVFRGVVKTLATQHNVTYYGPPLKTFHVNVTERSIQIEQFQENLGKKIFANSDDVPPPYIFTMKVINGFPDQYYDNMYHGKDIEDLLHSNEHFDLVITLGVACETFLQMAEKFDTPIILVAPSIPAVWNNMQVGNPNFLSTDISFVLSDPVDTITGRLSRFVKNLILLSHYNYYYMPRLNSITQKYYPPNTPTIRETFRRIALVFTNTDSVMGYARPNVPNIVEIGGLHFRPPKPIPNELDQFISGAGEHGVIYLSFGGTVRGSDLPPRVINTFINVFKKLPQRILWKMEDVIENLPVNVRVSKWFSQQDILGHRNVKLFITQGGMLSFQEASYHGVPVLVIPLIIDQYTNALLAQENKYGLKINLCDLSEEILMQHISELLLNPMYQKNSKEIAKTMKLGYQKPSEKVLFWTNMVLENRNTPLLQASTRHVPWIQLFHCDIFLLLLIGALITSLVLYYLFLFLLNLTRSTTKKEKIL